MYLSVIHHNLALLYLDQKIEKKSGFCVLTRRRFSSQESLWFFMWKFFELQVQPTFIEREKSSK